MRYLFLILFLSGSVQASTFVGNGGFAGDVELQVAIREMNETLGLIKENKDQPDMKLCVCYPRLEGHAICETLKKLNSEQVNFCANYLKENSTQLSDALKTVKIGWTEESINVRESDGLRAADAVTNFSTNQMTLQKERFLQIPDYERLFLLTHESGHLLKYDGKPIQDEQALGPFTGKDGGREFLNAIAAAVVMEGLDTGVISKYRSHLSRSQGHKQYWISAGADSLSGQKKDSDRFTVPRLSGSHLQFRYQFSDAFGVYARYRQAKGKENVLAQTLADEKISALGVGLSYRFFPFSNPLSFWGQSYVLLSFGAESLKGEYNLSDNFIATSDSISSNSLTADCSIFLPVQAGFWFMASVGYVGHQYSYKIPYGSVENRKNLSTNFGVAYGF